MTPRPPITGRRSNAQWPADLRGENGTAAQELAYSDVWRYALKCALNLLQRQGDDLPHSFTSSNTALMDYAADFAQHTVVKLWADGGGLLDSYRGEGDFTSWVARITNNIVIDELRRARYRHEVGLEVSRGDAEGDNDPLDLAHLTAAVLLGPDADRPEADLERKQLAEAVTRCFKALAPRQRFAFWAREIAGYTGQDIADQLGCTPNAVYNLIFSARRNLVTCLEIGGNR